MISDRYGRQFRNLRISLTASCNYACTYCVPDSQRLLKVSDELSIEHMSYAVNLLHQVAGIEKVRITGGEPLLSDKFDAVLLQAMAMDCSDVSFTTNGQLLLKKLPVILASGVKRVNLSLDTLMPERFRAIARSGDLATVLQGLDALLAAGITVKINMVPIRGVNDDEILSMLAFALSVNAELRYLELMRMGHLAHSAEFNQQFFGMKDILAMISSRYEFSRAQASPDSTAQVFTIPEQGRFGIIANETEPFCAGCTRLRLSSNGYIFGCLSNRKSYNIRPILCLPAAAAQSMLKEVLQSAINDKKSASFTGETTVMKFIGG